MAKVTKWDGGEGSWGSLPWNVDVDVEHPWLFNLKKDTNADTFWPSKSDKWKLKDQRSMVIEMFGVWYFASEVG